jgi:hypothetical protein
MASPGRYASKPRFKVGDRVVHKSNQFDTLNTQRHRRSGIVTDIIYRINKRGASTPFVEVEFDQSSCKEIFMAARLDHAEESN